MKHKLILLIVLINLTALFIHAQEKDTTVPKVGYYYAYANYGTDTTLYSEIIELTGDAVPSNDVLEKKWNEFIFSTPEYKNYNTGVFGPFDSKEAVTADRQKNIDRYTNPVKIISFNQ